MVTTADIGMSTAASLLTPSLDGTISRSALPAARDDGLCTHCLLPVPAQRRGRQDPFCCDGCARVYELLQGSGYGDYYRLRRGSTAPPLGERRDSLLWLDAALAEAPNDGPCRLTLDVQGIHCAACVWLLQSSFRRHAGGLGLTLDPALGKAEVSWDPGRGSLKSWVEEAESFGYRFGPDLKEDRSRLDGLAVRLGITVAAAMNAMVFALAFYLGLEPSDPLGRIFGVLSLILATVALGVGGWVFIRSALRAMRRGLVHLDLPIALGIVLAYGGSVAAYATQGIEGAYFDSVTVFIALMLLGRWLQDRVVARNRARLLQDDRLEAVRVRRRMGEEFEIISADRIETGTRLWVVAGEFLPVAARLEGDPATFTLDWITGESQPVTFAPGERVPAGAFHAGDAPVTVMADEPFRASVLHDLLARRGESPMDRGDWWRRVSLGWVTAVMTLGVVGFVAWIGAGWDRALQVTVSVLVVACPCAFGLAVPLARELTLSGLRRRGVFLRNHEVLDRLLAVRRIAFDKTGTVTVGAPALDPESQDALATLAPADRSALLSLTAHNNHPMSAALTRALLQPGDRIPAERVREVPGMGVRLEREGTVYRLGRPGFADSAAESDRTGTVFSRDGEPVVTLRFGERLKEDAREEIDALRAQGQTVYLVSGDEPGRVRRLAERVGIPVACALGGLTPEGKVEWVAGNDRGDLLFVGDGLNDAPALDRATCAATPAVDHPSVPARSDLYFLGEGIAAVRHALRAARRLRTVVRDDLALAVLYNAGAIGCCLAGLVTPVAAAILMPVSSLLLVSVTTFRLRRESAWTS